MKRLAVLVKPPSGRGSGTSE